MKVTRSYLTGYCTTECHPRNVPHLKKILRSLPNGKAECVNRWSQNCLSGKCDAGNMCTGSQDSQGKSNPMGRLLRGGNV